MSLLLLDLPEGLKREPVGDLGSEVVHSHGIDGTEHNRLAYWMELLRRKNKGLGFIQDDAFLESLARDRVAVSVVDGEPIGYCIWGRRKNRVKIFYTVVSDLWRRRHYATQMVRALCLREDNRLVEFMECRVRDDLPANEFWKSAGFFNVDAVAPRAKHSIPINVYRMVFRRPVDAGLYLPDYTRPASEVGADEIEGQTLAEWF